MDWLRYSNQGAIRSKPLSDDLLKSLSFLPELGVEMEVFSGGQAPKGSGGARTGSVRHDHGNAADVFFYKGGRRLDWANPEDQPIFSDIVRRAKQNGVTGFGAGKGYMQPGSMHIGFGTPSVWGTGGKGANAPSWLTAAYNGTPHTPNDGHNHNPATPQAIANDTMIALGKKPISEVPTVFGGQSSDKLGAEPMQQKPRGLLGMMFPDMDDEKRERIKYGLAGLGALSPVGANTRVMDRIDDRRDKREARAESAQQRNATAAWLAKQPGGAQYAEAIASGALPASAALSMYQQASKGQAPTKGVEINGQLINPITGEQIGDYRDPQGDDLTAKEAAIERTMESQGVDRATAQGIVDGILKVSRDPVDDTIIVTNLATGQSYAPKMPKEAAPTPPQSPTLSLPGSAPQSDASEAFGFGGMARGMANSAADFIGAEVPFPGAMDTASDFYVLRESLVNDIVSGYPRQPPSWLLKNIDALVPTPGSAQGAQSAQVKLNSIKGNLETELRTLAGQVNRKMSPKGREEVEQRMTAVYTAISRIDEALGRFGEPESNATQSGVKWRIEQ